MQVNNNAVALASMGSIEFARVLMEKLGEDAAIDTAEEIAEDMPTSSLNSTDHGVREESTMESCIQWAVQLYEKLFVVSIEHLWEQHPKDSVDEDGQPFWTGTRRMPKILSYSSAVGENDAVQRDVNQRVIDFVRAASRLRFEMYLSDSLGDAERSTPSVDQVKAAFANFAPLKNGQHQNGNDQDDIISKVASRLDQAKGSLEVPLNAVEFEKDDDNNGHVAFVTAASNLRALTYGIRPADAMETRRISGKIVPAMITTTAFVSALSCIELLKLIKAAPLRLYRNAFVNLALPFFAFTSPLPAERVQGLNGESHTLWDRTIIKEGKKSAEKGGIKLSQILKKVKRKTGGDVSSLFYGPYMIYANFLHQDDESVTDKAIWDLVKDALVSGDEIEEEERTNDPRANEAFTDHHMDIQQLDSQLYLEFCAVVENEETGEEAEIPPIRIIRWSGGMAEKR